MARSGHLPPLTKLLLVLITGLSLLTFILRYSAYVHVLQADTHNEDHSHLVSDPKNNATPLPSPQDFYVPLIALAVSPDGGVGQVLLKPWVLLTTSMIENGIVSFITTVTMVCYMGRYVETLWGTREFCWYLVLNVIVSNVLCFLCYSTVRHWSGSNKESVTITGGVALIMALIVAIKQRIPNHYLLLFNGSLRLRVSLVPFWFLFALTAFSVLIPMLRIHLILAWSSFCISWIYLRFYKEGGSGRQLSILPLSDLEDNGGVPEMNMRGDRTMQFAIHTFFPYPLSLLVKLIGSRVFILLVKLNILRSEDFSDTDDEETTEAKNDTVSQQELVSSMTESKFFTSSSLAGVSGKISTFTLPSFLQTGHKKSEESASVQKTLDQRREIALRELNK